ncbi:hypothetical protein [Nonomuraea sp. JJY05]|jgi:hypothetical protein|uniref:hypothetical protein n=1 Tax=Nonomuraea sp. JJY05 TaxID=3350255 RepID=UPI00373E11B2
MYPTPDAYLHLMRSDAAAGATGLYMAVNPLLEWLLIPAALTLAWHTGRQRRPLLIAAAVYYLQRITTYLYFAPTVLSWTGTGPVPLPQVALWLDLDLARMTLDLTVIAVLAAAALRRHTPAPFAYPTVAAGGPGRRA